MARFRGAVIGSRSEASRLGNRRIGVYANGWAVGVYATAYAIGDEEDAVAATVTGGSNDGARPTVALRYSARDGVWVNAEGYSISVQDGAVEIRGPENEVLYEGRSRDK